MIAEPSFSVGIEEEYMVVDRRTRNLIREAPAGLMDECIAALGERVSPEFLQCQIEVGTPVTITFDAFPELSIESAVSFRSSSIDPVNRTFQIEVDIANPEGRLAPQMVANVQVLRQRYAESIVVPLDALMESESGWFVYVADGGVARKVPIERVAIQESAVLTRGLQAHQQLVVVGQQNLTEGDSLKVVSQ